MQKPALTLNRCRTLKRQPRERAGKAAAPPRYSLPAPAHPAAASRVRRRRALAAAAPKQRALLNNNCAFAPDGYPHEGRRAVTSGRNPIMLRRILKPLESEHVENARYGYRMGTWLLANTKQSRAVRDEIGAAMKAALARHPGIDKPAR